MKRVASDSSSPFFFTSNFDGLARFRLEDFYFWPATSDLLPKPSARLGVAVAEDERARLHLADEFQQRLAVGVRCEVEVAHVAALGQTAHTVAVMKRLPDSCRLEPAAGRRGIGVADEKDAVLRVLDHALGQVVGGGVLSEHPGGHHEQASSVELDLGGVITVQHLQVECFVQVKIGVLPIGAVGLEVVNLGEHPAQPADENCLFFQPTLFHEQGEDGQHFLRPPQREGGDQHASAALECGLDGACEFADLAVA